MDRILSIFQKSKEKETLKRIQELFYLDFDSELKIRELKKEAEKELEKHKFFIAEAKQEMRKNNDSIKVEIYVEKALAHKENSVKYAKMSMFLYNARAKLLSLNNPKITEQAGKIIEKSNKESDIIKSMFILSEFDELINKHNIIIDVVDQEISDINQLTKEQVFSNLLKQTEVGIAKKQNKTVKIA